MAVIGKLAIEVMDFALIELTKLTKSVQRFRAVDNCSLKVREGIIVWILGPNGAGKTTHGMMAGILQPSEGKIIINNMDIKENPEGIKRITGFIPDRPFIYEKLTGIEFLRFIGGLYGLKGVMDPDKRIMELLEIFELSHWCDELVESYSHGMKQRLVMCSALLHDPKVLFLKNPL
jgi:ABC-2 type transport system ATP-binding protein